MKLTVKTLKGVKFVVDAEPSSTIAEVKGIIEGVKSELPAANMKLIHSGKVLKDDQTVEACNIKPNDFLVVMITKAKKPPAAAAPAPAPAAEKQAEGTQPAATSTSASAPAPAPATSTEAPAPAAASTTSEAGSAPAPAPASSDEFPAEVVGNLTAMGFPEAEVRACLRAAQGNPDVAVEFLMNGIPANMASPAPAPSTSGTGAVQQSGGAPLQALRSHPQFDALRRLVQTNPQSLQAVLTQIGQQQPELLREINENQAAFLEMMNEPVSDAPAPAPASGAPPSGAAPSSGVGGAAAANMLAGMADPAQMAQMLSNLSPTELNEMAAMMGLTPQQLQATAQMIGQMPPEQFQESMMQAMQQGGGIPGLLGAGGAGPGAGGGAGGGPTFLRLTEEEMASVDRLVDMGFDRAEAAQAFLACDKNEALAANLLMDSAGEGGGFGFGGGGGGSGSGGGSGGADGSGGNGTGGANDDGDGDDMYD